ncbi:uncharacterized protein [Nicotiana tomentosiformis]|uniref:uncharacterized protein n=1 Tax=Nicotiana tomentosiformis TaxID=4098 RepID=UPI00051B8152|nr:uncharacterized protein LOC117275943 [Nicotiana tomentosiformis]
MAPKKKARSGQRDNPTPGVVVDTITDVVGEHPRGENIPPTTTPHDSTIPAENAPIPPPTDIPAPPPSSTTGPSVSDGDLRGAIQMFTQIVASQAQRLNATPTFSSHQGDFVSSRVNQFLQLEPPVFTGTKPEEDPQAFNDEMYKTLRMMRATETEVVELASYHLKEVVYSWAARAVEFENLKQGSMSLCDYHIRFPDLSKDAGYMLPMMEARVRRFVQGLSPLVINEAATTALNSDVNYGKMVAFSQATKTRKLKARMERDDNKKARSVGSFGDSFSGGSGGKVMFKGGS